MRLADRALNRLLAGEPWARQRLAAHAGRRFTLEVGPARQAFTIAADGALTDEPSADSPPDLRLRLSALAVPAFLADPRRWDELVTADGDTTLAGTLKDLATTLPWFVERAFAHALGPIAGKRMADAGRTVLGVPGYVASRLLASAGRYARDESQLLAPPVELGTFAGEVEAVSTRAAAIEARIGGLEATRQGGARRADASPGASDSPPQS